jgi:hypothetical protein
MADAWRRYRAAVERDPAGVADVLQAGVAEGVDPAELAWVIDRESGWDPMAQNPVSTATGLLQWMRATRRTLGAPEPFPSTMRGQAPYVGAYLRRLRPARGEVYTAVFFPAAMGKPDDWLIADSSTRPQVWQDNAPLRGPDGRITAGSVRRKGTPPPGFPGAPGVPSSEGPALDLSWLPLLLVVYGLSRALRRR